MARNLSTPSVLRPRTRPVSVATINSGASLSRLKILNESNEGRRQAAHGHGQDEPVAQAWPALQLAVLEPKSGAECALSAVSITVVLSMEFLSIGPLHQIEGLGA